MAGKKKERLRLKRDRHRHTSNKKGGPEPAFYLVG